MLPRRPQDRVNPDKIGCMKKLSIHVLGIGALCAAVAIYCKSSSSPPAPLCPQLVKTFTETSQIAGYYCLCWDQIPQTGDSLPIIATYELRITAGSYKTHLEFDIQQKAAHVASTGCCAAPGSAARPAVPVPDSYSIRVNAHVYAPGDLIAISYGLPVTSDVEIDIFALLSCK